MFSSSEGRNLVISAWLPSWLRERIVNGMWWLVPLACVISLAGGRHQWFFRTVMAMFTLGLFRLWDDLEDVAHDRLWHPERAMCKASSLSQAYGVCFIGLTISCVFVATLGDGWIAFVAALFCVVGASRLRRQWNDAALRVVFAHVILLKVPALVIALSGGEVVPSVVLWRSIGLFGFVGAYEVIHDDEARRSSFAFARFLLAFDMVCLLLGLAKEVI